MTDLLPSPQNLTEFSLVIRSVGINKQTGERYWKATTSDILPDSYNDEMSEALFRSFLERIERSEAPPAQYCSEAWAGGLPYVSVAHYREHSIAGDAQRVYVDGAMLKANGTFRDTPLGRACFEALLDDLYKPKSGSDDPVRVSIAFLDYAHRHKATGNTFVRRTIADRCSECESERRSGQLGGRVFLDGLLIHFAMTRVPVNRRTLMEVEKSMTTRKEDAASIVGTELAEEMDQKERIERSEAEIVRSEDAVEELSDAEGEYRPFAGATTFAALREYMDANKEQERISDIWYAFQVLSNNIWMGSDEDKPGAIAKLADEFKTMVKDKNAMVFESLAQISLDGDPVPSPVTAQESEVTTVAQLAQILDRLANQVGDITSKVEVLLTAKSDTAQAVVEEHPLGASITLLRSDFDSVSLMQAPAAEKLQAIQPAYSALGEEIRSLLATEAPEEVVEKRSEDILIALLNRMNDKLDLMTSQQTRSVAPAAYPSSVPAPRSISPAAVPQTGTQPVVRRSEGGIPSQIRALAEKSVGL